MTDLARVTSVEELRQIYRLPSENVVLKQVDLLDDHARGLIALSPFVVLATAGENGLDCSPKGGEPGFVHVLDEKTLVLPDYPGNNRIDGLQNIVRDPRAGIIFFIPGLDEAFRVNGSAWISIDEALLARFTTDDRAPRSVVGLTVDEVYMHCGRAVARAGIWDPEKRLPAEQLPNLHEMFLAHVAYSRAQKEGSAEPSI